MNRSFVHLELNTTNPNAAKDFYSSLLGWKYQDVKVNGSTYTTISVPGGPGGAIQQKPMEDAPTQWLPYVQVADLKRTMARALELGGNIAVKYMEVPGFGALGIVIDPTGATVGLWEVAAQPPPQEAAPAKQAPRKKQAPKKKAAKKKAAKKKATKKKATKKKATKKKAAKKKAAKKAGKKKAANKAGKKKAAKKAGKKKAAKKAGKKKAAKKKARRKR